MDQNNSSISAQDNSPVPPVEQPTTASTEIGANTTETQVVSDAAPVVEPESDASSRRFAALARKQRELSRLEQEVKKEKLSVKNAQELQAKISLLEQQIEAQKQLGKQDLEQYLAAAGLTNDDLQQYYIKNIKDGKIPDLDSKITNKAIEEIRKENAELKTTLNSFLKEREQEKQFINTNTVNYVLNSDPSRYGVTNALRNYDIDTSSVVLELMDQYKQNGVNVSVVEACDAVEQYYRNLSKAFSQPNQPTAPQATKPVENKNSEDKTTRPLASLNNSITTAPPVRDGSITREQRRLMAERLIEREEREREMKR